MPQPSAPVPIRAWFWPLTGLLIVQFRPRLASGFSDERGYDLRADNRRWECIGASVPPGRGHFLVSYWQVRGIAPGLPVLDYTGGDLFGVNGLQVLPFADFPVELLAGPGF